jgi:hypothetical protein
MNFFGNSKEYLFVIAEEPETGIDPKCPRANGFFNHESPTECNK